MVKAIGCEDTPENKKKGLELVRKAAEGGHLDAMYILGTFLVMPGEDERYENEDEGDEWILNAAKGGYLKAMLLMGDRLMKFDDSPEAMKEGLDWYRKAAEGGHLKAMCTLGKHLIRANGCEDTHDNKKEGFDWYREAAKGGYFEAMCTLGKHLIHADGCEDTQDNKKEGFDWYREAAKGGDFEAMCLVGKCLINAIGCEDTPGNKQAGFGWFHRAAKGVYLDGIYLLAHCLEKAIGCEDSEDNKNKALEWVIRATINDRYHSAPIHPQFTQIFGNMTKQTALTVPNSVLEDDGHNGAGKVLSLLGQLVGFSALMRQEYNPTASFQKNLRLTPDDVIMEEWSTRNKSYGYMQSILSSICDNKKCFIPISFKVVNVIRDRMLLKYNALFKKLVVNVEKPQDWQTSYPLRIYVIEELCYLTIGDKNVATCNILLRHLNEVTQEYAEDTTLAFNKVKDVRFEIDFNQKMREKVSKDKKSKVSSEDLDKEEALLQCRKETLEEFYPEVRTLKDYDGNPTEHSYFEAAAAVKDTLYGYLRDSRPSKYLKALDARSLRYFQDYICP